MKNLLLNPLAIIFILVITSNSCTSKVSKDLSTLPKDISQRPTDENSQKYDDAALDEIRTAIDSEISKEKCTKSTDWTYTPIGSKACGGPSGFIAYPKNIESTILPKIESYTQKKQEYNKKYSITSDCSMPPQPTSVRCENGKGILVY